MSRTPSLTNAEPRNPLLPALVFFALVFVLPGCSQEDYSTPRSTVETAREALRADDADRLYRTFSENGRTVRLERMRSRIDSLPAEVFESAGLEKKNPDELSDREVFALTLRALRNSRRTNELLKLYASSEVTITHRSDTRALVEVQSRFPLPYERGYLHRIHGEWKIHEMEQPGGTFRNHSE